MILALVLTIIAASNPGATAVRVEARATATIVRGVAPARADSLVQTATRRERPCDAVPGQTRTCRLIVVDLP